MQDPSLRRILEDLTDHKGQSDAKMLLSQYMTPSVAVLVAWDDTSKCYRRVVCDSNGKLEIGVRIATVSYTGDGAGTANPQEVTGVGFAVKAVWILPKLSSAATCEVHFKLDVHDGVSSEIHSLVAGSEHYNFRDAVISLDSDGFSVADRDADAHPNKNGQVYIYLALGCRS